MVAVIEVTEDFAYSRVPTLEEYRIFFFQGLVGVWFFVWNVCHFKSPL